MNGPFSGVSYRMVEADRTPDGTTYRIKTEVIQRPETRPIRAIQVSETQAMTVCIAAICSDPSTIICAADRLLTMPGGMQYESDEKKIFSFGKHWVLASGIMSIHSEVIIQLRQDFKDINDHPTNQLASEYCTRIKNIARTRAEISVLNRRGLDFKEFHSTQGKMKKSFVVGIQKELDDFYKEMYVGAILVGIDSGIPHLFYVDLGGFYCKDYEGFIACGGGDLIAMQQFVAKKYTEKVSFSDALLLTYHAKRCAEVVGGVGPKTDIFLMDSESGNHKLLDEDHLIKLDEVYKSIQQAIEKTELEQHRNYKMDIESFRTA